MDVEDVWNECVVEVVGGRCECVVRMTLEGKERSCVCVCVCVCDTCLNVICTQTFGQ